jgi:hypothetical protein
MANELKVFIYATSILTTGYALMKYTVPDEETMKKVELHKHYFEHMNSDPFFS